MISSRVGAFAAQGISTGGQKLIVQACRRSGGARSARLSVSSNKRGRKKR